MVTILAKIDITMFFVNDFIHLPFVYVSICIT